MNQQLELPFEGEEVKAAFLAGFDFGKQESDVTFYQLNVESAWRKYTNILHSVAAHQQELPL